jgi:predicted RNA-binding protein YlqC (UPF0109 family)
MQDIVFHLVKPIVKHPDAVKVQVVEGEATVMLEMSVHAEDRETVEGENGRTLRSIRNILSAAAGRKKATLDLVEEDALGASAGEE